MEQGSSTLVAMKMVTDTIHNVVVDCCMTITFIVKRLGKHC